MSKKLKKKEVNVHTELEHSSEVITQATGKAMGLQLIGMFKHCKACALGKAKKARVSKTAVPHSTVKVRGCLLISALPLLSMWVVRNTGFLQWKTVLIMHGAIIQKKNMS